ncbi:MAG: hypothetical protein J4F40_19290 [Alphaproteobacteria bacterium]|nr:hypothetical protein [Alphaproteobacteria bacterium]MCY4565000.1 hypothetical protein [Gammaproteobacteria bacterium]
MAKHRIHTIALKRQVVQEYFGGEALHSLNRRYNLSPSSRHSSTQGRQERLMPG